MDKVENLKAENARLKAMLEEYRDSIKRLTGEIKSHEAKEQSISSAILFAMERGSQWDSSMHKLYELGIQRTRLLFARMERVLNELYVRYPDLKKEPKLTKMIGQFRTIAFASDMSQGFEEGEKSSSEHPIKKLLNNIVTYIDDKKPVQTLHRKSVPSALDAINSEYASTPPSSSGFNINEALNPTENLEDILKSFNLNRDAK